MTFPSVLFLKLDMGGGKKDVVDRYLEVRYNRTHVDRLEDIHLRIDSIPYHLRRALQEVVVEDGEELEIVLVVALTYRPALRPDSGEVELESKAVGLASGGRLGFALPEERVIGESTYIVLDFPRCVDSVDASDCRFLRPPWESKRVR